MNVIAYYIWLPVVDKDHNYVIAVTHIQNVFIVLSWLQNLKYCFIASKMTKKLQVEKRTFLTNKHKKNFEDILFTFEASTALVNKYKSRKHRP